MEIALVICGAGEVLHQVQWRRYLQIEGLQRLMERARNSRSVLLTYLHPLGRFLDLVSNLLGNPFANICSRQSARMRSRRVRQ